MNNVILNMNNVKKLIENKEKQSYMDKSLCLLATRLQIY